MTLFELLAPEDLLAVRFAVSPVWERQAAVQAFVDERGRSYHEPWLGHARARAARLDLVPLLAVLPRRGYVPDFLTPPPQTCRPGLRAQLAGIRATDPAQVSRELAQCRETVADEHYRRLITSLLTNPERARDQLAARLHEAWAGLVAPRAPSSRTRCPARRCSRPARRPSNRSRCASQVLLVTGSTVRPPDPVGRGLRLRVCWCETPRPFGPEATGTVPRARAGRCLAWLARQRDNLPSRVVVTGPPRRMA